MRKLASQRWKRNSGSWSELRCRGSDFPAMIWLNIRQTDTPQRSALNAKADDPTCEHVHHHHDPVAAQEYRFAAEQIDAPQAVLHMPDKAQPGRAIGSCLGSIVFREYPAGDVFVDIDAKGVRKLLCDAGTANTGVAAFDLYDRVDELLRRSLRAGTPMTSRREEPPIFAFLERLVESEQGSGLQDDGELRNSAWRHEQ